MSTFQRTLAGGVLVLLGFFGVRAELAWAQMHYSGGFVVTPKVPSPPVTPATAPAAPALMDFGLIYPLASYPSEAPDRTDDGLGYRAYYPRLTSPATASVSAPRSKRPYGLSSAVLPWRQPGFEGYDEQTRALQDSSLTRPDKYMLKSPSLNHRLPPQYGNVAVLAVHLPEDSPLWIQDNLTRSMDPTRYFVSPPLKPGKRYTYFVRSVWFEEGRWVTQTREVPVRAGQVRGIYLSLTPSALARKKLEAKIEANLAKLSPDDQKVARLQRVCVVESGTRLGADGVPVLMLVKNRRVFLCNEACMKKALAVPEQTLARALAFRSKNGAGASGK